MQTLQMLDSKRGIYQRHVVSVWYREGNDDDGVRARMNRGLRGKRLSHSSSFTELHNNSVASSFLISEPISSPVSSPQAC